MPTSITRRELEALLRDGAQVVEVLPQQEYDDEHLPGAINLPLRTLKPDDVRALDTARPVVVYCWDAL
jgi:rhodanese-related sulfurtransferase